MSIALFQLLIVIDICWALTKKKKENVLPVSGLRIIRTNFPLRSVTREVQRAVPMISWEPVIRVSGEKGSAAGGEHPARGTGERAFTRGGVHLERPSQHPS